MNKLKEYQIKRDFKKTNEPEGKKVEKKPEEESRRKSKNKNQNLSEFVVQFHRARREHFDFRLQWKGVLLSWAVPKGPSFNPADKRLAVHVEDHPVDYANFEGLIPKGQYGGGSVLLWDRGTFEPLTNFDKGMKEGSLKFRLFGERLQGAWALVKLKDDDKNAQDNWLLIKDKDEFAKKEAGISQFTTSVLTGKTSAQLEAGEKVINKKNPFETVQVQLAKLVDKVPSKKGWFFEVKYDGYRIVAFVEQKKVKFVSRNNQNFTSKFEELAEILTEFSKGRSMVLDGEMIVIDQFGRSDFQALQNHLKRKDQQDLIYMVFDLLALDGEDLRELPLQKRREKLVECLKNAPNCIMISQVVADRGQECFEAAQKLGLEGIVGKRKTSIYHGERTEDWIKLKCYHRQEFVIGGFTCSSKSRRGISALLLGVFKNGKFVFCGRAGTGLNQIDVKQLKSAFKGLKLKKSAFENLPKMQSTEEVTFLKPELVCEVQFAEWTEENNLRQASYKGLRIDKAAKDVTFEISESERVKTEKNSLKKTIYKVEKVINSKRNEEKPLKNLENTQKKLKNGKILVKGVEISNPNKFVFEDCKVKKIDVVNFYLQVAERMMPHLKDRVLSVVRCHGKVKKENCFFKKHPNTEIDGVEIVSIENSEKEAAEYFYISKVAGLIGQVQLGTIEFHLWGSHFETLNKPDMMVFDLDPDEGMELKQIRQGVRDLKKVLDGLRLKSFLKTSGGKGYHIVVPFVAKANWETFHDFAENVAKLMENRWPKRYTSNIRKDSRKGKIFIDWVRNGRGATSVAPYSLRARAGAKVSMPIAWSQLNKIAPNQIDLKQALLMLKKPDPWKDYFKVKQELKEN